jgi:HemK-like putative methylase
MVRMARAFLERKGVEEARLEAELLVAHALHLTRLQLFMQLDRPITAAEIDSARDLLVRRGKREPVAYITGEREFYGRAFRVGHGALVPRPETELLVDRAREIARERTARGDPPRFAADLGTGTGCIAATLALEIDGLDVVAVDSSAAALAWARENVARLGARVELVEGEGFATLARITRERGRGFDLLLSNPPYVMESERASLAPKCAITSRTKRCSRPPRIPTTTCGDSSTKAARCSRMAERSWSSSDISRRRASARSPMRAASRFACTRTSRGSSASSRSRARRDLCSPIQDPNLHLTTSRRSDGEGGQRSGREGQRSAPRRPNVSSARAPASPTSSRVCAASRAGARASITGT